VGLLTRFRKVQTTEAYSSTAEYYGAWKLTNEAYERIMGMSPGDMWRTQPYLRTVVTFLARNIAQLGLHSFQRLGENDRKRLRDGVAEPLARPNRATTSYELVFGLVADLALHDVAYWLLSDDPDQRISRLPVPWVTPRGGDHLGPEWYEVRSNDKGESVKVPADSVLAFHGWHPGTLATGSSPVAALREILAEQVQAARYRENVWKRGGKVGAVLTRPPDAPDWSDDARKQFKADWESQFTGNGPKVGGTPLLEDGMTLTRVDFNSKEMQFIEGSRLALNTVASVYHINPTMIGLLDNANYSNVREFRRMLYGDTLGPILAMIEDRLNAFYVPRVDDRPDVYVEFNIEEKLQGNFEEQTAAIQSATGRPWMTANEARALRNMPAIDGGDELVVPLNVLLGGQASPTDSTPKPQPVQPVPDAPAAAALEPTGKRGNLFAIKARANNEHRAELERTLTEFFDRQGKAVLSAIGSGAEDWWDAERWDRELTNDLHAASVRIATLLGRTEARSLGFDPEEDYDADRTVNFLRAVAERYARNVNLTTKGQLDHQLGAEDGDPSSVYHSEATASRVKGVAGGVTTCLAGFATTEAAKQIGERHGLEPTKTWVTGPNPRLGHAVLDGETVKLHEDFSNGQPWPGSDPTDEDIGCNCSLLINA
jgi:HK97 family phage portal protein